MDRPRVAVEKRELGEAMFALALGVDRAGIDEIEAVARQGVTVALQAAHFVAGDFIAPLLVAVAEEADAGAREVLAQEFGIAADVHRRRHVELHVAHPAVDEGDAALDQQVCGQGVQPAAAFRGQLAPRPLERIARLVRAAIEAQAPGADQVVVAGDDLGAARAQSRDAGIRVGVVADDIADAEDAAHAARLERGKHRLERLEVAVDVA